MNLALNASTFFPRTGFLCTGLFIALLFGLSGCATLAPDGGVGGVQGEIDARLETAEQQKLARAGQDVANELAALLATQPLSAESAVRIALLNNPALRMSLADLGIADAERVQVGRLRNPGFGYGRTTQGAEIEIERLLMFNVFDLLTMPARTAIAQDQLEAVRLNVSMNVLAIALSTRKAWIDAVTAKQAEHYWQQVNATAKAGAQLGRRMAEVGNWGVREQAREHDFYAEASTRLALAQQQSVATREHLIRQLGLWGEQTAFVLPDRLPNLPQQTRTVTAIEAQALRERLDVQQAKQQALALSQSLDLSEVTRFGDVLDVGGINNSYNDADNKRGYAIEIVLPIFDWGDAKVARAEAVYMQAVENLRATAIRARSESREAYLRYRTAFDIARHYSDEIVPLRQRIAEENVLRYNGMLIGVFELLADARVQIQSVVAAIESQRNFWLADADLRMALSVGSPSSSPLASPEPAASSASGGH
jgi:outer membrane protein TolC